MSLRIRARHTTTRSSSKAGFPMIRNARPLVAIGLAAGIALASVAGATTAQADPTATPGQPPAGWDATDIYASVGADAFAELTNELATQYNDRTPTPAKYLASYDAINPVTGAAGENIVTKPGCTVARPNGANAGITAIKLNNKNTDGDYCIDWVRSSRSKKTDGTESSLTFYAQSRDAVGYATVGNAYAPTTPLTAAQLKDIFECTTTDWSEVGGQAGDIHVYLPPASAATLTFFLTAIGTDLNNVTTGCGATTYAQQQNDGRTLDGDPQGIAPYAITKWAAQLNGAPGISDYRGGAHLGFIGATAIPPTTTRVLGDKTYAVLNPDFTAANPSFKRLFYNVVRTADAPAELKAVFEPGGFLCSRADELLIPFGNTPLGNDTSGGKDYCGQSS